MPNTIISTVHGETGGMHFDNFSAAALYTVGTVLTFTGDPYPPASRPAPIWF